MGAAHIHTHATIFTDGAEQNYCWFSAKEMQRHCTVNATVSLWHQINDTEET